MKRVKSRGVSHARGVTKENAVERRKTSDVVQGASAKHATRDMRSFGTHPAGRELRQITTATGQFVLDIGRHV